MTASSAIEVQCFHQVLMLPLRMQLSSDGDSDKAGIDALVTELARAAWEERFTPGQPDHDYTYAEMQYLLPDARRFLFGGDEEQKKARLKRRLVRTDVCSVKVTLSGSVIPIELRVERVELLLMRPCVAILLIELSDRLPRDPTRGEDSSHETFCASERIPSPLSLEQVLHLQNQIRRVFPPYFDQAGKPGDCPTTVEWTFLDGSVRARSTADANRWLEMARNPATQDRLIYDDWAFLLCGDHGDVLARFHHVGDDRCPGLSFIAVQEPENVELGDRDRLAAYDPPGLQYSRRFRRRIRDRQRYDRFTHWGTTYFCNGQSFVMLTKGERVPPGAPKPFPTILLEHFRRHYTNLALLAHYQHAALLFFRDRLAEAAAKMAGASDDNLDNEIRRLYGRFLKYTCRASFDTVSPQEQGQDLFNLWRRHLRTARQYNSVNVAMRQFLARIEVQEDKRVAQSSLDIAHQQASLARTAERGIAASIGLAASATFLQWCGVSPDWYSGAHFGTLGVAAILGIAGAILWNGRSRPEARGAGGPEPSTRR